MREISTKSQRGGIWVKNLHNQWLDSRNWCELGEVKLEIQISGISLSVDWVLYLFIYLYSFSASHCISLLKIKLSSCWGKISLLNQVLVFLTIIIIISEFSQRRQRERNWNDFKASKQTFPVQSARRVGSLRRPGGSSDLGVSDSSSVTSQFPPWWQEWGQGCDTNWGWHRPRHSSPRGRVGFLQTEQAQLQFCFPFHSWLREREEKKTEEDY